MPWDIKRRGSEYIVVREGGKVVGRHGSRKEALAHQRALYATEEEMKKAYKRQFASRSEAARYAARIRWGNRNAADGGANAEAPAAKPAATDPLAQRINEGSKALRDAGFTVEVLDAAAIDRDKRNELDEQWYNTFSAITMKPDNVQKSQYDIGNAAINKTGKEEKGRVLIVARDPNGVVAGVASVKVSTQGVATLSYMASSKTVKGTGSALFGDVVKHVTANGGTLIRLEALATANSFWREMGFFPVANLKRPNQIMERGMLGELVAQIS